MRIVPQYLVTHYQNHPCHTAVPVPENPGLAASLALHVDSMCSVMSAGLHRLDHRLGKFDDGTSDTVHEAADAVRKKMED